jgi:hypothetical protein
LHHAKHECGALIATRHKHKADVKDTNSFQFLLFASLTSQFDLHQSDMSTLQDEPQAQAPQSWHAMHREELPVQS